MIKLLRSKLIKLVKSKRINVFLLFLLLSFLFLLLTKLTKDYTKTITFQIKPVNAVENYVILKDRSHKLNITLSTYGFKLLRFYLSNPTVEVDLSKIDDYDNKYIWTNRKGLASVNAQFDENVRIIAVNPDTIEFRYDKNAVKVIPVEFNKEVSFVPGFDIYEEYQLIPDSIKVIGPKILLDSIKVIQTQLLKLEEVQSNINTPLNLILPDSSENVVYSHKKIIVQGNVDKFTEGTVQVPINIINVPKDLKINYFPKTIGVSYYTSLRDFKDVAFNDFIVECNYKNLVEGSTFLEPQLIRFPENVKNIKLSQKRIEFVISE
ncbi:MAG: YbbR-like domain-containing protein [Flavobacteriaceae bacterium]|nr:YbbR-like domain-containing protein [Flavobacteriaceae bacterium]